MLVTGKYCHFFVLVQQMACTHNVPSLSVPGSHSNFLTDESVYESEPSKCEKEEAWLIAMERIDPNGYISK